MYVSSRSLRLRRLLWTRRRPLSTLSRSLWTWGLPRIGKIWRSTTRWIWTPLSSARSRRISRTRSGSPSKILARASTAPYFDTVFDVLALDVSGHCVEVRKERTTEGFGMQTCEVMWIKTLGSMYCRELIRVLVAYIHIYIYIYVHRPSHVVVWACVVCFCVCVCVSWPFCSLILSLWVRIIFPREGRLWNLDGARENTQTTPF